MSDHEMRQMLLAAIRDIDSGRLVIARRRRWSVRRLLTPPLIAASMGLAACGGRNVGAVDDATVPRDVVVETDVDSGPVDLYGIIVEDAGPMVDAAYMGPFDAGPEPPYMAPFDGGIEPDYAAPFDADVDMVDGGEVPLYMGPPPNEP